MSLKNLRSPHPEGTGSTCLLQTDELKITGPCYG